MKLKSLGHKSDLIFPEWNGIVKNSKTHMVIRTPSNPKFFWGNYLIFPEPPQAGDFKVWCKLFDQEIGCFPGIGHKAFTWDTINGEKGFLKPFLDAGYTLERSVILAADQVVPPVKKCDLDIEIRSVITDSEWHQVFENQKHSNDGTFNKDSYAVYIQGQIQNYRALIENKLGV